MTTGANWAKETTKVFCHCKIMFDTDIRQAPSSLTVQPNPTFIVKHAPVRAIHRSPLFPLLYSCSLCPPTFLYLLNIHAPHTQSSVHFLSLLPWRSTLADSCSAEPHYHCCCCCLPCCCPRHSPPSSCAAALRCSLCTLPCQLHLPGSSGVLPPSRQWHSWQVPAVHPCAGRTAGQQSMPALLTTGWGLGTVCPSHHCRQQQQMQQTQQQQQTQGNQLPTPT